MAFDSIYRGEGILVDFVPAADVLAGGVVQLPDGRAAVAALPIAAGKVGGVKCIGLVDFLKPTGTVFAAGTKVYWDGTLKTAKTTITAAGPDFYLGTCAANVGAGPTYVRVHLNIQPTATSDALLADVQSKFEEEEREKEEKKEREKKGVEPDRDRGHDRGHEHEEEHERERREQREERERGREPDRVRAVPPGRAADREVPEPRPGTHPTPGPTPHPQPTPTPTPGRQNPGRPTPGGPGGPTPGGHK